MKLIFAITALLIFQSCGFEFDKQYPHDWQNNRIDSPIDTNWEAVNSFDVSFLNCKGYKYGQRCYENINGETSEIYYIFYKNNTFYQSSFDTICTWKISYKGKVKMHMDCNGYIANWEEL